MAMRRLGVAFGWVLRRECHAKLRPSVPCRHVSNAASGPYTSESHGTPGNLDYRVFVKGAAGTKISPWHDIPLYPQGNEKAPIVHFVNEIPRLTNAKFEISHDEEHNPIKQDTKKGLLRFLKHQGGVLHNYGAIPQTWEDPGELITSEKGEKFPGDNDPIDALDISTIPAQTGQVLKLKVLGVLGLIDEGECDWKVIGINALDPMAKILNDITDVRKEVLDGIREWYRVYKVVDGKAPNQYLDDGEAKDQKYALTVIEGGHNGWKKKFLKGRGSPSPS